MDRVFMKHLKERQDKRGWECEFCGHYFHWAVTTKTFSSHLTGVQGSTSRISICESVPENVKEAAAAVLVEQTRPRRTRRGVSTNEVAVQRTEVDAECSKVEGNWEPTRILDACEDNNSNFETQAAKEVEAEAEVSSVKRTLEERGGSPVVGELMDQRDSTVQRNRRQRTMPDVLPIVAEVEVPTVEDFFNIYEGQLDKLKVTLRTVTKVVGAAEQKQFTDRDVREWLHDLKDAALRAEDFLDKVAYEVLKLKIESGGAQTSANAEMQTQNCTGQVRQFLPCFNLCRKGMSVGKVESRLKEIHETLEHLLKQMGHLGLEEKNSTREERSQKLDATSLVDTSSVYGRDGDAVSSMVYEANARIRDPVYGCVGAICQLQKQVNELQAQLAKSQAELVNMQHQQANLVALLCMEITSPSPPPHHNHQQHSPLSHDDTMDNVMMITSTPQFYPTTNPNWLLDETFLGSTWEEPLWT